MKKKHEEQKSPQKKKRRFSKFRFYFLNILLAVVIVCIIAAMAIYAFCTVHTVKVKGNTICSEDEIKQQVLDDSYSKNTVYAFVKNLVKPKTDIPFVEKVNVKLKGYDALEIDVKEKKLFGCILLADNQLAYFDENGQVVEISDRVVENVMQVSGVTLEKANVGSKVGLKKDQLAFMLNLLKIMKKYEIGINSLSFDERGRILVAYGGIVINVGDKSYLEEKIMRLPHILPNIEGQTGILHLENWTPDNTDIVFERAKE